MAMPTPIVHVPSTLSPLATPTSQGDLSPTDKAKLDNLTPTTALTVNTGTVTLVGNVANTSALTLGAGASSVSGANTGDETPGTISTKSGELLLPPVANNFDPTVTAYSTLSTGHTPVIGSVVGTLDGTKSWQKWGSGALQWAPLHTVSAAFGSNLSTWDTTALVTDLACDVLGGFRLTISGTAVVGGGDVAYITLRWNGAAASTRWLVTLNTGGLAVPNNVDDTKLTWQLKAGAAVPFFIEIESAQPYSGSVRQVLKVSSVYDDAGTPGTDGALYGLLTNKAALPQAAIASIGVAISDSVMGAACVATLTRF